MARQTTVTLIDDLSGGTADESVEFSIGGHTYEIDLSARNASKLRTSLAPFIEKARKARTGLTASPSRRSSAPRMTDNRTAAEKAADRERGQLIRTWAKDQGLKVADRGRMNVEIVQAFDAQGTPEGAELLARLLGDGGSTPEVAAPVADEAPVRQAADMSDDEITAWAESQGRKIKKNSKGDITPATMKGLRADYDKAIA